MANMHDHDKEQLKAVFKDAMTEAGLTPEVTQAIVSMAGDYTFMTKGGRIIGKVVIAISVIVGIMVGVVEFFKALKGH